MSQVFNRGLNRGLNKIFRIAINHSAGWLSIISMALVSGCFSEQTVLEINRAENIRKTTDGRIFITGGQALFELIQDQDQNMRVESVFQSDDCDYFAGLAELQGWLFFVCSQQRGFTLDGITFQNSGTLLAYSLERGDIEHVMNLSGYQFANGLDAVPQHNLILLADENFAGKGGVSKLTLDFNSGIPQVLEENYHWIGATQGVYAANGVRALGNSLFLTDIGRIKRVDVDSEWRYPETAESIVSRLTVLDDFDFYCNGLLVTDYIGGDLLWTSLDGNQVQKLVTGLTSPSAVLSDPTPLFSAGQILFTESVGILPDSGHRLAVTTLPVCP